MQNSAFELVRDVIFAERIVGELSQYRHKQECPQSALLPEGRCNCGADRNNERLEELRRLLDIHHKIEFSES